MIDIKDATKAALSYLASLVPDAKDPQLEEVEISEDEKYWLITLSFLPPGHMPQTLTQRLHGVQFGQKYKIFKVDSTTGKVVSMKVRLLEHA